MCGCDWDWRVSEEQRKVGTSQRRLGRYNDFSDFLFVELTWIDLGFFIHL